jgi:hypothetical protein
MLQHAQKIDVRTQFDDGEMHKPGWKYNHWEQKGARLLMPHWLLCHAAGSLSLRDLLRAAS